MNFQTCENYNIDIENVQKEIQLEMAYLTRFIQLQKKKYSKINFIIKIFFFIYYLCG